MGTKGKFTFYAMDESGNIDVGQTYVRIVPAGGTYDGPSSTQMADADSNGTYIIDLEDDGLDTGLYDVYVDGVKEIDSMMIIDKDTTDDVDAHGVSITAFGTSIGAIITDLAAATGDIDSLQGTISSLITDVASISAALDTHEALASDPHGATLTQSRIVTDDVRGASPNNVKIQAKNGTNDVKVIVENYGSPSGYGCDLELTNGDFHFGDDDTRFYKSGTYNFVLDVNRSGATSKFQVINSDASKTAKFIVDGGISADVEEVVAARGGYQDLDTRLDLMDSATNVIGHVFENMNELQGFNETGSINTDDIHVMLVTIPHRLSLSRVRIYCQSACGAGETFDIGLYDSNGDLQCSIGGTVINSSGIKNYGLGSSYLLDPGEYYVAITGTTANGAFYGYGPDLDMNQRWGYLSTGGAALPGKIIPGDITTDKRFMPYLVFDSEIF